MSDNVQTNQEKPSILKKLLFLIDILFQISAISTLAHKTYTDKRLMVVNTVLLILSIIYFLFTIYAFWRRLEKKMCGQVKRTYKRCRKVGKLYSRGVMLYVWFTARNLSFIAVILIVIMSILFLIELLLSFLLHFIFGLFAKNKK